MSDDVSAPVADPSFAQAETLVPALEAVLFSAPEPLAEKAILQVFGDDLALETLRCGLELLRQQTSAPGRGIVLAEVAGGWQFLTRPEMFGLVKKIAKTREQERLTPAGIETLAVVAYKQPVTRAEVDAIRGAASGPILRTLMDRGLVRVAGRSEVPGAPFTYGTTKEFLSHFGLRTVRDLPDVKEWGRILSEQGRERSKPSREETPPAPEPAAEPS